MSENKDTVWVAVLDANVAGILVSKEPIACQLIDHGDGKEHEAFIKGGPNDGYHVYAGEFGVDDLASGRIDGTVMTYTSPTKQDVIIFILAAKTMLEVVKKRIVGNSCPFRMPFHTTEREQQCQAPNEERSRDCSERWAGKAVDCFGGTTPSEAESVTYKRRSTSQTDGCENKTVLSSRCNPPEQKLCLFIGLEQDPLGAKHVNL